MFIGRTLAGPQVRGALRRKGAQGTATPFREVATRIPRRRGKRGAHCMVRRRMLYYVVHHRDNSTSMPQSRGRSVGVAEVASWARALWLVGGVVLRADIALLADWGARFRGLPSRLSALFCLAHALASERLCVCGWNRASYSLFVLLCARCLVWVVM